MKWLSEKGKRDFEECVELTLDFENRTFTLEYYFNHPRGGAGNSETFAFEDFESERFRHLIECYGSGGFDETFGAGAEEQFKRLLRMSPAEYAASAFKDKKIVVDLTNG